jgi:hypothetical protein
VNVDGKWYYIWDKNGDGTITDADKVTHDSLQSTFTRNVSGDLETTDNAVLTVGKIDNTFRYGTINGVRLALPTHGGNVSPTTNRSTDQGVLKAGTAIDNSPAGEDNPTYNDLLAIWDGFNGSTTATTTAATITGWRTGTNDRYWSATPAFTINNYTIVDFGNGRVADVQSTVANFVAFEVLQNQSVPPVVLDLNRDGTFSYQHVIMDVNSDGVMDKTLWAGAQDGVLVWDKYQDGHVHDHSQYAFTLYGGSTDLEGLAAGFDTNTDGVLDAQDEKFDEFMVWQDSNQNGVSDAGEVSSLVDWGIASIDLVSDGVQRSPVDGVTEAGRSTATTTDGQTILVADAAFDFRDATAVELALQAVKSAEPSDEWQNKPHDLSDEELAAIGLTLRLEDVLAVMPSNGVEQLMLGDQASPLYWLQTQENLTEDAASTNGFYVHTVDTTQPLLDEHLLNAARVL